MIEREEADAPLSQQAMCLSVENLLNQNSGIYYSFRAAAGMHTSQNDAAPKLVYASLGDFPGIITSQNDAAPKLAAKEARRAMCIITSQNDAAPKPALLSRAFTMVSLPAKTMLRQNR